MFARSQLAFFPASTFNLSKFIFATKYGSKKEEPGDSGPTCSAVVNYCSCAAPLVRRCGTYL
jgi:hypothetical protein